MGPDLVFDQGAEQDEPAGPLAALLRVEPRPGPPDPLIQVAPRQMMVSRADAVEGPPGNARFLASSFRSRSAAWWRFPTSNVRFSGSGPGEGFRGRSVYENSHTRFRAR